MVQLRVWESKEQKEHEKEMCVDVREFPVHDG